MHVNWHFIFLIFCLPLLAAAQNATTDTLQTSVDTTAYVKKPLTAEQKLTRKRVRQSAMLPGLGQLHNGEKWKTPLIGGGILATFGTGLWAHSQYKNKGNLKGLRNGMFASAGLIYGINLFDAFAVAKAKNQNKLHSPIKAAYFSTLLPGLGQIYNKKAWKLPIVYGAFGVATYFLVRNTRRFKGFSEAYVNFGVDGFEPEPYTLNFSQQGLLNARQFYLRNLEISAIVLGVLYIANIIDAVVDAHLFDFDVGEDLSLNISPQVGYKNFGVGMNIKF